MNSSANAIPFMLFVIIVCALTLTKVRLSKRFSKYIRAFLKEDSNKPKNETFTWLQPGTWRNALRKRLDINFQPLQLKYKN